MINNSKLSENEIIRDWSLSKDDLAIVLKINKQHRLWLGIQICSLRLFGQFLNKPNQLASEIIVYICKQISIPIVVTVEMPQRDATKSQHKKLIFEYLGFSKFDDSIELFKSWVQSKVEEGIILTDKILLQAESFLIKNRIAVPTLYRLRREINSICHNKQEEIYNSIYQELPQDIIDTFNDALLVIDGQKDSWFQKFKEYPGTASITLLKDYLQRYKKISEVDLSKVELDEITQEFVKYLFKLGKYYDATAVKRFRPAKRYTLMLAFFYEAKRVLIDYIIQMHDQYISNICRECKNIHNVQMRKHKHKHEKAIDSIESVVDYLIDQDDFASLTPNNLYQETISKADLKQARDDLRQFKITSKHWYANLLQNRYSSMRRYFAEFIHLDRKSVV